jgi:hypothetical protein
MLRLVTAVWEAQTTWPCMPWSWTTTPRVRDSVPGHGKIRQGYTSSGPQRTREWSKGTGRPAFFKRRDGGKLAAVCKDQAMQEHGWCGCKIACKLGLPTRCRKTFSFTFWHFYSQVLFEKDLWGLQNRSGRDDAHRNPSPCRDPNLVCPARTKLSFL